MHYRADIDGLRAVAVLAALFFHAGFSGFDGGYVGIEIFFVVSGYLITNIILHEQDKRGFSLIDFYERRARRILPALTSVLFITTIAAYLLMPAYLLEWYSQSLVAVSSFISNIYFYYTTGYFAPSAGEKPLLHMWSLAVEEQYYFVYPLFMLLFLFMGWRKHLPLSVLLVFLLSLSFTQFLAEAGQHKANYYHTFSRTWELLTGALIALLALDKYDFNPRLRELMCFSGLVMIFYAICFFTEHTVYPSFLTLVPVMGTALIIIFGQSTVAVSRLLSLKWVVLTGLMSYSVYLWHHPVYAFLRLKTLGEPTTGWFVLAVIATLILAYFSWRFVELPFRDKTRFSRKQIFGYSALSIAGFIAIGSLGQVKEGFPGRFTHQDYADSVQYSEKRGDCHTRGENYLKPEDACEYFASDVSWAVMGDSHSVELAWQLARRLESRGEGVKHLSFSDCPPSLYFRVQKPGCSAWFIEALEYLESSSAIENVVLVYRHSKFLYGEHAPAYPGLPDEDPNTFFTPESRVENAVLARSLYWQSFKDTIKRLGEAGKKVYVIYPVPELPMEFRNGITPFWVFSQEAMMDVSHSTTTSYYRARHAYILSAMDSLPYGENLIPVKTEPVFCDPEYCFAVEGREALYIDDDHPSLAGAKRIVNLIDL